jgi:hypothetical protein
MSLRSKPLLRFAWRSACCSCCTPLGTRSASRRCYFVKTVYVAALQTAFALRLAECLLLLLHAARHAIGLPPHRAKIGRVGGPGLAALWPRFHMANY